MTGENENGRISGGESVASAYRTKVVNEDGRSKRSEILSGAAQSALLSAAKQALMDQIRRAEERLCVPLLLRAR